MVVAAAVNVGDEWRRKWPTCCVGGARIVIVGDRLWYRAGLVSSHVVSSSHCTGVASSLLS